MNPSQDAQIRAAIYSKRWMHHRWPPAELELFCDPAIPSKTEVKCDGVTLDKETTRTHRMR